MSAQNPPRSGVLGAIIGTIGFSVIAGILVGVMATPVVAVASVGVKSGIGIFDSLPSYIKIDTLPQVNTLWAKSKGQDVQIATIYAQNRQEVAWNQISQNVKNAAVDGEDRRYYQHGGIDPQGIARALLDGLKGGRQQGASTIAQQLVKNIFVQQALELPTPAAQKKAYEQAIAVTLDRKLKEMKLAIALEKKYTKQQILLAYLNIANFGDGAYGIQSAAQHYYNTDASNLSIAQAASLIAIVQQPSARAPVDASGYAANKARRDVILGAMRAAGDISEADYQAALKTPVDGTTVTLTPSKNGCIAANQYAKFFCSYVQSLVPTLAALGATPTERKTNWANGGYQLHTTLDLRLQTIAQNTTWHYVPKHMAGINVGSATDSVEVGTGRVLVMTESKDFNNTQATTPTSTAVNFSVDEANGGGVGFQVGSTYKPFTLINWLESGHGLNEVVDSTPVVQNQANYADSCQPGGWSGTWTYRNDENERGPYTVMRGTARSVNGVFANLGKQLDQCQTMKIAQSLGVHTGDGKPLQHNPSAILGINNIAPLTMAAAYAGIANGGIFCQPIAVDSIVGPTGQQLPGQAQNCTRAIDADIAAAAGFAMQGVFNGGTASAAKPADGVPILGKTGTTDSSVHTWTVGSSTKVSTAVWVGNITGLVPTRSVSAPTPCASVGGAIAVLRNCIFRETMTAVDRGYRGGAFPAPAAKYLTGSGKPFANYIGQTINAATVTLQALGFTVNVGSPVDSAQPAGTVAKTSPVAGTLVSSGFTVTLYPSKGNLFGVPQLVGLKEADATAALNQAGFTNYTETCTVIQPNPGNGNGNGNGGTQQQDGYVDTQSPAAGTAAKLTAKITFDVTKLVCP